MKFLFSQVVRCVCVNKCRFNSRSFSAVRELRNCVCPVYNSALYYDCGFKAETFTSVLLECWRNLTQPRRGMDPERAELGVKKTTFHRCALPVGVDRIAVLRRTGLGNKTLLQNLITEYFIKKN